MIIRRPGPTASVVIPAHNEGAVLGRCLDALLAGGCDDLQVVVVVNATTDDTAEVARARGVTVIETERGGKAGALNLGDASCSVFPRIYLDADVELDHDVAVRIAESLRGDALVASPRLRWSPAGTSRLVRAYYRVWTTLPYHRDGVVGSGLYALSEAGRARFGEFPDLIADDGFVASHFRRSERLPLPDCAFTIHPPRTVRSLVAVKTRVWLGNQQLRRLGVADTVVEDSGGSTAGRANGLAGRPELWASVPVYAAVYLAARITGWWRLRTGRLQWTRDDTSRVAAQ